MGKGTLKQNGVHLKEHEYKTVKVFLEQGYDVELIPASQIKGFHAPDIMLQGVPWEMKAPQGSGKNTIKNTVQNASHQSENIILDLRRCKLPQDKAAKEAEQKFMLSKRLRRLKIVLDGEKILDFSK
ncbi:MAG: hypothetical protein IJP92_17405 [Lachnospiraceae bacterium]|nr:hypothetical protein [Lachnospiraceae bacterium]